MWDSASALDPAMPCMSKVEMRRRFCMLRRVGCLCVDLLEILESLAALFYRFKGASSRRPEKVENVSTPTKFMFHNNNNNLLLSA